MTNISTSHSEQHTISVLEIVFESVWQKHLYKASLMNLHCYSTHTAKIGYIHLMPQLYFVLYVIILKYVKDMCNNYNSLSFLISHIRCTKKVWKPTMTQLKCLFYFFVYLLHSTSILKLKLLDYNYMYIHNNLHDQLNYNFHYSLQLY